jgi:hypothetical protein
MEVEHTRCEGYKYAWALSDFEMKIIAKALAKMIPKYNNKIKSIEDDPDNDGSGHYQFRIDELVKEKQSIEYIIKEFSK